MIVTAALALVWATQAFADDGLSRKPGAWEVKTAIEGSNAPSRTVRQCIDTGTDQLLQSSAGPFNPAACERRNVQRSAERTTIDFVCTVAGKPATARSVITGSFESSYTMTVTAESGALPGGKMIMTMDGHWLGACPADQRPGDVVLSNGVKVNVPDLQKQAPSPPAER
jgi:hypothetical protein